MRQHPIGTGLMKPCKCRSIRMANERRGADVEADPHRIGEAQMRQTCQLGAAILKPMRPPLRDRKFADSSLERDGFEPLVPRQLRHESPRFPKHPGTIASPTAEPQPPLVSAGSRPRAAD